MVRDVPDAARKLLVTPGSTVRVVDAPDGADELLGALPAAARHSAIGSADVVVATEFTPVTQVARDETWNALRVRPLDEVGR
jgi:hypothetical protein